MIERILDETAGRIEKPRESLISRAKKCRYFSPVNTLMIAINVIVFFLTVRHTYSNRYLVEHGALYWPYVIGEGEYYRLFTYMFLHSGYSHIVNNMLVLLFIGDNLERAAGKIRYLIIYLGSGIMAGVVSMLWNIYQQEQVVCVGASGAIFGVVGAVAFIVIINKGRLEDISGRQIILFVILSLYGGLTSQGVDNAAHIGGLVTGAILAAVLYRRKKKAPARIEQATAESRE
ncbi:MAG TPA: rhomboid family intramembrane serine protease [Candidatus Caccomorpha excrementavium]|nr:rhomboid family intramembrane serine protease [Candidatus Caccomorpha excrementavium]